MGVPIETLPHLPELLERRFPGQRMATLYALPAQLSTRRYYRLTFERADTAVEGVPATLLVMRLPPEEPADGPSRMQAHAFVDIQRFMASHGVAVPAVYAQDIGHGLLLLEDVGDVTFEQRLRQLPEQPEDWYAPYSEAIELLARVHALPDHSQPEDSIALRRHFEATLLRSELDHFREWGLEALHGPLMAADRAELDAHFDRLTAAIVALPVGFVHRDYQSRNLMCAPDGRLVVLDFQDAFMGPFAYDLVALLCDSYVELDAGLQDAMLLRYAEARDYTAAQLTQLVHGFRLIAVQRKLKDAGRFVFIDRMRQNPNFLPYYPGSLAYAARALRELPEFADLRRCLSRLVPGLPA